MEGTTLRDESKTSSPVSNLTNSSPSELLQKIPELLQRKPIKVIYWILLKRLYEILKRLYEILKRTLLNLKGKMNIDPFENGDQYNRRELLTLISLFGLMGTTAFLLNGCSLSRGFRQIKGEVLLNGRRISPEQLEGPNGVPVPSDASISTGSDGSAIFVIGRDAFLMRGSSRVELKPNLLNGKQNEISGFNIRSGAILSVFARKKRTLRTLSALIGIRGTGVYLETDSSKTYVCTCYGTSHL